MMLNENDERICHDVICLDITRPWLALVLRQIVNMGLRPRLMNSATGLELANWRNARCAIFDLSLSRLPHVVAGLRWLCDNHPHVIRIVVTNWSDPVDGLVRESGADWILTSVFDVPALTRILMRSRGLEFQT
ncbi:MAG TPA: hypothetical protein VIY86_05555 [Pirellulaceae bacterium]